MSRAWMPSRLQEIITRGQRGVSGSAVREITNPRRKARDPESQPGT